MAQGPWARPVQVAVGVALIALGALFAFEELLDVSLMAAAWPLVIVAIGALFFAGMIVGGERLGALAIPGSILVTVGLVLFVQNATGAWQTWAYAWALVTPGSVGLGLLIFGAWSRLPKVRQVGWGLLAAGAVAFAVFGAFFELVVGIGGLREDVARVLWPALLVAGGLIVVIRGVLARR